MSQSLDRIYNPRIYAPYRAYIPFDPDARSPLSNSWLYLRKIFQNTLSQNQKVERKADEDFQKALELDSKNIKA